MRYLLMLQILIAVVQPNLEARQRASNVRGVYTLQEHIGDHEIVIPRKVNHQGDLISHNVTHHHHKDGPIVHYRVAVAGNEYHIELTAADNFVGRAMVVERRKRDLYVRNPAKSHGSKCHYRGFIKGHRNSRVALSACDGLAGMLHGDHGEFWLEPVAVSLEEKRGVSPDGDLGAGGARRSSSVYQGPTAGRPHLIFRRSAEQRQLKIGVGGRGKRRRKKKRRQERNCGTREPRRLTETRLEWQTQPGLVQVQGRGRRKHQTKLPRWHRSKRSISTPRHVEVLVVADWTMTLFHQDGDVETYLLTIMNMVSSLYLDPTIGNFINIVVVKITLIEDKEKEKELNISDSADDTLYHFCKWQQEQNPGDDSHPNHHDVAILVTRRDICSRKSICSTLGVAHVAGMCQPDRSCSVNEDNGITLAHTITHELGHNFGMYHDTEKIGCSKRDGDTLHVMTPSFEVDAVGVAWSRCSRRDITNFLDQGKGDCLEDEPSDNDYYTYPDLPPGAMYNAEHQCRLQFGVKEAAVCSPLQEICSKLWCIVDGTCSTMLHPAAPGTHCGKHMWCQNQECVPIVDRPRHIDGGWGEWGSWSKCSRTCGAGVSIVERKCDHPEPAHGGKFCIGERRRYKICNTKPCLEGKPSFRAVQCRNYNGKEYKGKNYTWLPYFDQMEPCELYCTDTDESVIVPWGEAALDGTPCNVGTRDMCIAGICRKVGCDWIVDSDATEDRCGICHGDGTQCETTSGFYNKSEGLGYKEVVVIPAGSRNIKIEETSQSTNYIGIGAPNSDKYFLNGKRQITLAGEYDVAGTPALYEREQDKEKIRIPGPIKEAITVYAITRSPSSGNEVHYEYTVPKKEPIRAPEYSWVFSDWSLCTVTCGKGTQTSQPVCHEKKSGIVENHFCDGIEKPQPQSRECNLNSCPTRWWVGPWQMCPVTCGKGALRKRSVMCVVSGTDRADLAVPDRDCKKNERPKEVEPCPDLPVCGPTTEVPLIVYADNKDTSFYNISDQDGITIVNGLTTDEPEILEFDNVVDENPDNSMYNTRPKWTVSKWSHCSNGKRSRKVTCFVPGDCNPDNKPASVEDCRSGKWITGNWGTCNATCLVKSGVKQREVQCRDRATNLLSDDCNPEKRPFDTKRCYYRRQCYEKYDCKNGIPSPAVCANYRRMCEASSIAKENCCAACMKRRRHVRHNRRHITAE
ncbi:PREDICTED: A disintegrin and metalloproteinase with thrombospondin motifs 7-like [Dinoponera quadriceps]|uniref:A disintegrin and metalloproteinase with thrombospondin motifs 7-like n=1 Tax=Dinoponera quadriceps TaxID=609295 RepID=A0A6P3X6C6_DINQU|nr:PREDICTED: A disintegrin and metalloproteinase with thrombospondin motifs 7-like [Dinoponera quadriceps]